MGVVIESSSYTHVGKIRAENQDALYTDDASGLWLVADGMGGHSGGKYASNNTVNTLKKFYRGKHFGKNIRHLSSRINDINKHLYDKSLQEGGDIIGTTLLLAHVLGSKLACCWVGDSRLYRLRHKKLKQLSRDHCYYEIGNTIANCAIDVSQYSSQALTRALGADSTVNIETAYTRVCAGDRYLLCSDGLTKELTDSDIKKSLLLETLDQANDGLVNQYQISRARDNLAFIVLDVQKRSI